MLAYLFRYDVIKRLSHGYCPIGPMGNAMRLVHGNGLVHGNAQSPGFFMGMGFPWEISHGQAWGLGRQHGKENVDSIVKEEERFQGDEGGPAKRTFLGEVEGMMSK